MRVLRLFLAPLLFQIIFSLYVRDVHHPLAFSACSSGILALFVFSLTACVGIPATWHPCHTQQFCVLAAFAQTKSTGIILILSNLHNYGRRTRGKASHERIRSSFHLFLFGPLRHKRYCTMFRPSPPPTAEFLTTAVTPVCLTFGESSTTRFSCFPGGDKIASSSAASLSASLCEYIRRLSSLSTSRSHMRAGAPFNTSVPRTSDEFFKCCQGVIIS